MFDEVNDNDGSGVGFSNKDGSFCDGIECEVRENDEVELSIDGARIVVTVTEVTGQEVTGVISSVPFGVDLQIEAGDSVDFTISNIIQCAHP